MERDSFVFRKKWYEALQMLNDKKKAAAFDYICQYALYNKTEEPTDPTIKMVMVFINQELKDDCDKWINIREKRSEAGKKGGAPAGNQNAKTTKNKQKQPKTTKNNQNQAKQANAHIGILQEDNIIDNISSMGNIPLNISSISPKVDTEDLSDSSESDDAIRFNDLISFWNECFKNTCIAKISSISGTRKSLTTARIKQFGKDKFADAIRKAAKSSYLTSGEQKWFSFDWFIKPNNFPKVLEGNYDDMVKQQKQVQGIPEDLIVTYANAMDRYYDGDRTLVWFGDDPKKMRITTKEIAEKYSVPHKPFVM